MYHKQVCENAASADSPHKPFHWRLRYANVFITLDDFRNELNIIPEGTSGDVKWNVIDLESMTITFRSTPLQLVLGTMKANDMKDKQASKSEPHKLWRSKEEHQPKS
jgi:hypothetical protein